MDGWKTGVGGDLLFMFFATTYHFNFRHVIIVPIYLKEFFLKTNENGGTECNDKKADLTGLKCYLTEHERKG